jgi:hypothetical protein
MRGIVTSATAIAVAAVLAAAGSSAAGQTQALGHPGKSLWSHGAGKLAATHHGAKRDVHAKRVRAFTLDATGLDGLLDSAAQGSFVVSLPDANGGFQRFELQRSQLMAPGLAQRHPEIQTYSGHGIDDPAATIHADLSPLGFHASVRSPHGGWYIDPYYHIDRSVYGSYLRRGQQRRGREPLQQRRHGPGQRRDPRRRPLGRRFGQPRQGRTRDR